MRLLAAAAVASDTTRLVALADVKLELGQFAEDPKIERLIDQATDEVLEYLGWPEANAAPSQRRTHALAEADYVETIVLPAPRERLWLSRRWLVAPPSVEIDGAAAAYPADYDADLGAGCLYRFGPAGEPAAWEAGVRLVVVYKAGFKLTGASAGTAPPTPRQIERAVTDLVSWRWTQATGAPCGQPLAQVNLPGAGLLSFATPPPQAPIGGLPQHVVALLEPFRFNAMAA